VPHVLLILLKTENLQTFSQIFFAFVGFFHNFFNWKKEKLFLLNLNELAQNRGEYHSLKENFKISKLIQKFLCKKPFFYFWRFFWWKATIQVFGKKINQKRVLLLE
jgi:hypothetical protein